VARRVAGHERDLEPGMPFLHPVREPSVRLLELTAVADDDELALLGSGGAWPPTDERRRAGTEHRPMKGSAVEHRAHSPTPFSGGPLRSYAPRPSGSATSRLGAGGA